MCMHNIDVRRVYFLDILRHVPMFVSQVGRIRWEGIFHQVQPPASLANNSIYISIRLLRLDLRDTHEFDQTHRISAVSLISDYLVTSASSQCLASTSAIPILPGGGRLAVRPRPRRKGSSAASSRLPTAGSRCCPSNPGGAVALHRRHPWSSHTAAVSHFVTPCLCRRTQ